MSSNTFDGKIVLVTGSSSGIGEEIVIQFAKRGAKVIVTGRDDARITSVVEQCNKESPNHQKALGLKCDIQELVNKTIKTFGGLDILVNNAGIPSIAEITDKNVIGKFDMIMNTNLRAPFLLIHFLVPHLIKSKGNIINISSVAGLHALQNRSLYCGSKAALDMITKCLAIDLGPKGVRVNSVNPAAIRTPIFGKMGWDDELVENRCKAVYPLHRIGEVKDVGNMVSLPLKMRPLLLG